MEFTCESIIIFKYQYSCEDDMFCNDNGVLEWSYNLN
jgi:hypothetical protein